MNTDIDLNSKSPMQESRKSMPQKQAQRDSSLVQKRKTQEMMEPVNRSYEFKEIINQNQNEDSLSKLSAYTSNTVNISNVNQQGILKNKNNFS